MVLVIMEGDYMKKLNNKGLGLSLMIGLLICFAIALIIISVLYSNLSL